MNSNNNNNKVIRSQTYQHHSPIGAVFNVQVNNNNNNFEQVNQILYLDRIPFIHSFG